MTVTRQEVEEELDRKSASIAGSISRIKKELSLPTEPVKSAVRNHPIEMIVGTVAAGLALGWVVSGKRKRKKKPVSREAISTDFDATEFLNFVRAGRISGLSEEDAVSRALAAIKGIPGRPPRRVRATLTEKLTDHVIDLAEAVIKTAIRVATREAAAWLAESVRRDKPDASQ